MTESDPYAGITETACPAACAAERCIITGENICGHPNKGGLQEKFIGRSEYITRRLQAVKAIKQRV